jgi:D-alanine-D-alanine ligase-like ATP-grasp enzyme
METICPDCGPATVSHGVERWNARADNFFSYVFAPLDLVWNAARPAVAFLKPGRIAPAIFTLATALGLGRITVKPDERNTDRTRVLWEEAEKRGIAMREFRPFGLPRNIFFASYKGDTRVFDGLPRPRLGNEAAQNWMDDKGVILEKFHAAGIPVPRGGAVKTFRQAEVMFHDIVGGSSGTGEGAAHASANAAIIKPALGSRSRHTYMHITTTEALQKAFAKAKEISPRVVVEEELPGFVFRITLVGGAIAGVMRREPPHVLGDGKHTLQELITEENKNPLRHGAVFHTLEVDPAMLVAQNTSLDAVPAKNNMVILHPKVSRSFGASNTEIEDIHPDNRELFLKIARVLDDPLVGVDFIMKDMARSWKEQKCGVIECNSLPFIDLHHFPLKGPARNVAGMVWDLIF